MAVVPAVLTEDARKYWVKFFGGLEGVPGAPTVPGGPPTAWDPRIKFFKVGEGGWIDPGTGRVRRDPDATLRRLSSPFIQDIDAVVDAGRSTARYGTQERATFYKSLTVSDISFIAPYTIEVRCLLDFAEFNDDGYGNAPEIWEIGIFGDHPEQAGLIGGQGLMVAYGTFSKETKDNSKQVLNIVRFTF
jgi:hypothetical protein